MTQTTASLGLCDRSDIYVEVDKPLFFSFDHKVLDPRYVFVHEKGFERIPTSFEIHREICLNKELSTQGAEF